MSQNSLYVVAMIEADSNGVLEVSSKAFPYHDEAAKHFSELEYNLVFNNIPIDEPSPVDVLEFIKRQGRIFSHINEETYLESTYRFFDENDLITRLYKINMQLYIVDKELNDVGVLHKKTKVLDDEDYNYEIKNSDIPF